MAAVLTRTQITLTAVYLLAFPLALIWLSGDWRWVEGWAFSIWFVALSVGTMVYLYQNDPALLAERYRRPGTGAEPGWDKYMVIAFQIMFIGWFVTMPLDARRFHWTDEFPLPVKLAGACLLALSAFFMFRASSDNTFLSPLVRIQTERAHRVVSTGVYAFVRHPMYLGAVCLFFGASLFLSSSYGLGLGLLLTLLVIARIGGEERLLRKELEGYEDYRRTVKYRLVPFIW